LPPSYRHYARLWLRRDYASGAGNALTVAGENVDFANPDLKAPHSGMQVHLEYTQSALFFHLKHLLANVERIRLCVDRDPGMDTACLAAFAEEIRGRRADVFLIQNLKSASSAEKKMKISIAEKALDKFRKSCSEPKDARALFVTEQLRAHRLADDPSPWFIFPLADMAEPAKAIQYLTDFGDYDLPHLARLHMRATMRGIDRFFMQVRRRLSLMERPISTANAMKTWYGYAAYSPVMVERVLAIFRTYYNFCLVGEDGKTPAMRLGLTESPTSLNDVVAQPQTASGLRK